LTALTQNAGRTAKRVAEIGRLLREPSFGPPVELTEAAREAAAEVNVRRPPSPVELRVSGSLPAVPLSESLLRAVLVQLLTNAAQAGTPGQAVAVHVEARYNEGDVWLSLRDEGRGMSEAQLTMLSEPFAPADSPVPKGWGWVSFWCVRPPRSGAARCGWSLKSGAGYDDVFVASSFCEE